MFPNPSSLNLHQQQGPLCLLLVPFHRQQRGNTLTADRIYQGLRQRGLAIECVSLEDPESLEYLRRAMGNGRYAMIHGLNARHLADAFKALPELEGIPLLLTTTGTDLNQDLAGQDKSKILTILRRALWITVFNRDFKAVICKEDSGLQSKIVLVPQGVWLPEVPFYNRRDWGLKEEDLVFVLPSGLRPVKRIEMALEGLSRLKSHDSRVRLIILGASIDPVYTEKIQQEVKARAWVFYLGEIPHQQVAGIYQLADIVLNTSLTEGQPQAAIEAMSLGKPALLSAVPGNMGVMEHGRQGYYFSGVEELVHYGEKMARENEERAVMGQAAARLAGERFPLSAELDAYETLYRTVLEGRASV